MVMGPRSLIHFNDDLRYSLDPGYVLVVYTLIDTRMPIKTPKGGV